jgi:23S rRNA (adenine2503-C2)-methyltransferase
MKPLIHSLDRSELERWLGERGEPLFRAGQILQWLYEKRVDDPAQMSNLPQALRIGLVDKFCFRPLEKRAVEGASDGVRKLLVRLTDGELIEAVLIPAAHRRTVCVSSQAGCKFACAFCASGRNGLRRSLEPGEMTGQVLLAAAEYGDRVTHVVFMGVGEPFDNYEAVLKAARLLNSPAGCGIAARRITVSTCGLIPGIRRFAQEPEQFELSVSLHAPGDALRTRLMPVNRRYPLDDLLVACRDYTEATGRIITFEYTLVRGVNDMADCARQLIRRLETFPCRVNLIPLSPTAEFEGAPPDPATAAYFIRVLEDAGINATLRRSKGGGVQAACGQLRASSS